MPDTTRAACRAALLKACEVYQHRSGRMYVLMDDAAACMAEREAKLREVLQGVLTRFERPDCDDQNGGYINICEECDGAAYEGFSHTPACVVGKARAALAAAQEVPRE